MLQMIHLTNLFILLAKVPSAAHAGGKFTRPYNSAAGVPENVGWFIVIVAVIFFSYLGFKLNKGLKEKKPPKKKKKLKSV